MTHKELEELVCRAYEPAKHMMNTDKMSALSLPRVMAYAAQSFWIHQTPETDDMREIRRQFLFLDKHGHFDVERTL